jgi:hypothetical protein
MDLTFVQTVNSVLFNKISSEERRSSTTEVSFQDRRHLIMESSQAQAENIQTAVTEI